jgi:hypothetical protein
LNSWRSRKSRQRKIMKMLWNSSNQPSTNSKGLKTRTS